LIRDIENVYHIYSLLTLNSFTNLFHQLVQSSSFSQTRYSINNQSKEQFANGYYLRYVICNVLKGWRQREGWLLWICLSHMVAVPFWQCSVTSNYPPLSMYIS